MPQPDYTLRQNDAGEAITATLEDSTGAAVNLTGSAVRFQLAPISGGDLIVDTAATITNPAQGKVSYTWVAEDTEAPGLYLASWQVTFSGGAVQTFPNGGYTLVLISGELGLIPDTGDENNFLGRHLFIQAADPGAVGAGAIWIDTSGPFIPVLRVRNYTDDGWVGPIDGVGAGIIDSANNSRIVLGGNGHFYVADPAGFNAWGAQAGPDSGVGAYEYFRDQPVGPTDADLQPGLRFQWFDGTDSASALRFKQMDLGGNIVVGKAAGLTANGGAFLGVTKPNLPTNPTAAQVAAVLASLGLVNLT